jgi:protein farnesyltransferase subunit beta
VISVASLLGTLTPSLAAGTGEWIARCQTFEGGLGGEPGTEAHGGYAFCGLAASVLLKSTHKLNIPSLLKWAAHRQMEREGGFQGRTNKLVDGCYSFWMGALFPLLHGLLQTPPRIEEREQQPTTRAMSDSTSPASSSSAAAASTSSSSSSSAATSDAPYPSPTPLPSSCSSSTASSDVGWLFDTLALQRYVLVSCQVAVGGLRDKPGKHADLYHTCYCLSGLAVAQHATTMNNSPVLGREENLLVRRG